MRKIVLIVSLATAGCAGTQTAPQSGPIKNPSPPIVSRQPSLARRYQFSKQREQQQLVKSEVTGNVVR